MSTSRKRTNTGKSKKCQPPPPPIENEDDLNFEDVPRFVNPIANSRYVQDKERSLIRERGFATNWKDEFIVPEEYKSVIRAHKWEVFCAPPIAAIILIIREFYANAFHHDYTLEATVRGKL